MTKTKLGIQQTTEYIEILVHIRSMPLQTTNPILLLSKSKQKVEEIKL
jgi:hypothetical protein